MVNLSVSPSQVPCFAVVTGACRGVGGGGARACCTAGKRTLGGGGGVFQNEWRTWRAELDVTRCTGATTSRPDRAAPREVCRPRDVSRKRCERRTGVEGRRRLTGWGEHSRKTHFSQRGARPDRVHRVSEGKNFGSPNTNTGGTVVATVHGRARSVRNAETASGRRIRARRPVETNWIDVAGRRGGRENHAVAARARCPVRRRRRRRRISRAAATEHW